MCESRMHQPRLVFTAFKCSCMRVSEAHKFKCMKYFFVNILKSVSNLFLTSLLKGVSFGVILMTMVTIVLLEIDLWSDDVTSDEVSSLNRKATINYKIIKRNSNVLENYRNVVLVLIKV